MFHHLPRRVAVVILTLCAAATISTATAHATTVSTIATSPSTIGDLDADGGRVAWLENEYRRTTCNHGYPSQHVMYTSMSTLEVRRAGCNAEHISNVTVDGINVGWWQDGEFEANGWSRGVKIRRMYSDYNPPVSMSFGDEPATPDDDITTLPPSVGMAGSDGRIIVGADGDLGGVDFAVVGDFYNTTGFTPIDGSAATPLVGAAGEYEAWANGSTVTVHNGGTFDAGGTVRDLDLGGVSSKVTMVATVDTTDTPTGRRLMAWNLDTGQLQWQRNIPGAHSDVTSDGLRVAYRVGHAIVVRRAADGVTLRTVQRHAIPRFIRLDAGRLVFAENIGGSGYIRMVRVS